MTDIVFKQVEDEVRKLAAASPDFRYPDDEGCFYNATETQTACIFGRAFSNLGYPVPERFEDSRIATVFFHLGITTSRRQDLWANAVQMEQDDGEPWAAAVRKGDLLYPLPETTE